MKSFSWIFRFSVFSENLIWRKVSEQRIKTRRLVCFLNNSVFCLVSSLQLIIKILFFVVHPKEINNGLKTEQYPITSKI